MIERNELLSAPTLTSAIKILVEALFDERDILIDEKEELIQRKNTMFHEKQSMESDFLSQIDKLENGDSLGEKTDKELEAAEKPALISKIKSLFAYQTELIEKQNQALLSIRKTMTASLNHARLELSVLKNRINIEVNGKKYVIGDTYLLPVIFDRVTLVGLCNEKTLSCIDDNGRWYHPGQLLGQDEAAATPVNSHE